jgi:hypothetical protein
MKTNSDSDNTRTEEEARQRVHAIVERLLADNPEELEYWLRRGEALVTEVAA